MEYCNIYHKLSVLIIFYSCALVISNQNHFPSLLQQHIFSFLMTCLGRENLSLTWDPPITNHNHSIDSFWAKLSPALHFLLFEKPFPSDTRHNREEKTIATLVSWQLYLIDVYKFTMYFIYY